MMREWRDFLIRGNVVDLAVAVVLGIAFGAVINALVENILTPLIAAIVGQPDFSALKFTLNDSDILYGNFLNALVSFILIASAVFFVVVKPMNVYRNRTAKTAVVTTKQCTECLSEIPLEASRCAFCTSPQAVAR